MKEKLINLNTAKLCKERGFNLNSPAYYSCDDPSSGQPNQLCMRTWIRWHELGNEDSQDQTLIYNAPSQSILQKWLRDNHNINVLIDFEAIDDSEMAYTWKIMHYSNIWGSYEYIYSFSAERMAWFENYEQALESGLQEALKLI